MLEMMLQMQFYAIIIHILWSSVCAGGINADCAILLIAVQLLFFSSSFFLFATLEDFFGSNVIRFINANARK